MKRFKPGDICIATSGYYKGIEVEVISYFSATKIHVKTLKTRYIHTFFIPEDMLQLKIIIDSPLYKALL